MMPKVCFYHLFKHTLKLFLNKLTLNFSLWSEFYETYMNFATYHMCETED